MLWFRVGNRISSSVLYFRDVGILSDLPLKSERKNKTKQKICIISPAEIYQYSQKILE